MCYEWNLKNIDDEFRTACNLLSYKLKMKRPYCETANPRQKGN